MKLPLALTELGLIDEYEILVHPRLAGHGPTLFAGLSKHVDLKLVGCSSPAQPGQREADAHAHLSWTMETAAL